MYLIVGLGNPGEKHKKTRHNVGFMVVEKIADKYNLSLTREKKFTSLISQWLIEDKKNIVAMPFCYMNNSGKAISEISNFYKISSEKIIIIYDDLDLPLGKLKISFNSSAGGHNGVKSIIQFLGTQNFIRVRVGIGNELSASRKLKAEKFVLQNFSREEMKIIFLQFQKCIEAVGMIIKEGYEKAMNVFNSNS